MVHIETRLLVADNSGAKVAQCIGILGGSRKKRAGVGDVIVVAVKEALPRSRVKKGEVRLGVVVRTASDVMRSDGSVIRFDNNAIVLINNNHEPLGSRVFGPVVRELRAKNFLKIISLAQEVL